MNTKGHCYPKCIILRAVYFKLRFTISYRDVEEIMKIRGMIYVAIQSWVYKFARRGKETKRYKRLNDKIIKADSYPI